MPFQVSGTKKGGMPVTVEKRPKGKVATVIGNVRGDKAELLAMVKAAVGAGGSVAGHDSVEIQGDHAAKIQQLLLRHQDRTGHATMKGVAGLKPKPEKPEPREEESRARREEKVRSAEVLAQQKQRRVEARQRAVREAVNAKVESTRHFHVYANMMKTWRYWDQNWDALREMHDRHIRDLDEAARAGRGRGITSILDAEVDEPAPGRRRGEVLEAIDRGLAALGGAAAAPEPRKSPECATRSPPPHHDQRAALMALGMIAAPSPFRQSRQERLAEAKRRQAAAKEAAKNAPPVAATAKESTRPPPAFDPALAALRAFGDYPDRSRPAASAAARPRPPPVRPAATRPPPSRVPRGGAGRGAAVGTRRRGHGKGDPKRSSLGYTGARKGTGGGVYGGDVEEDRDVAFDDDESEEEEEEEEDRDYLYAGGGDTRGWEASPSGGFSFGPIAGAENPPSWQHLSRGDERVEAEMDQEEADLREALRRSLLEADSRRSEPTRRVGLHVECGDLWGELTEEEAFELAKRLSEEQEKLDRASRAEFESFDEPARCGLGFRDRDSKARDPRDRLAELCGFDADDEAAVGLADLVSSMDTLEEAADLVAATAGCDRGEAEEVAAALRDDGDEPETEEPEIEESSPADDDDAAGFMPKCMDEDAALAEALRLSKLDAETRVAAPAFTDPAPALSGDLLGWADAQLSMFTGEEDNAFLAEYVCDMETAAEIEEFLRESFPSEESSAAASFARALVLMRS